MKKAIERGSREIKDEPYAFYGVWFDYLSNLLSGQSRQRTGTSVTLWQVIEILGERKGRADWIYTQDQEMRVVLFETTSNARDGAARSGQLQSDTARLRQVPE